MEIPLSENAQIANVGGASLRSKLLRMDSSSRSTAPLRRVVDDSSSGSVSANSGTWNMQEMSPGNSINSASSVRQRAIHQRMEEQQSREREYTARLARHAEAAKIRSQFLGNHRITLLEERASTWTAMCVFVASVRRFQSYTTHIRHRSNLQRIFFPIVLLRLRRWIRRCRVCLVKQTPDRIHRPTIADLRTDRMLALFPDAHLQNMIDGAVLRYYFKDESIIFMGCEEDECFFLVSGTAEVVMNGTCVYTLTPGMMFGTVGMISGEPRTATIIGRSPVFVWAFTRSTFEQFGACSAEQLDVAKDGINKLRQQNLISVFHPMLTPVALASRFPILSHVNDEFLQTFVQRATPVAVSEGAVIMKATCHPSESEVLLVLRGKVGVFFRPDAIGSVDVKSIEAQITQCVEGPNVRDGIAFLDRGAVMAGQRSVHNGADNCQMELLVMLDGPLLIGMGGTILGDVQRFEIRAVGRSCDALRMPRRTLLTFDILDLAALRDGVVDLYTRSLPPLTVESMMLAIGAEELPAAAVRNIIRLALNSLKKTPRIFLIGNELVYDANVANSEVLFIVSGSVEDRNEVGSASRPFLWPDMHGLTFGGSVITARAKTRVEAFAVDRRCFLESFLCGDLREDQVEDIFNALHCILPTQSVRVIDEVLRDVLSRSHLAVCQRLEGSIMSTVAPAYSPHIPLNKSNSSVTSPRQAMMVGRVKKRAVPVAEPEDDCGDSEQSSSSTSSFGSFAEAKMSSLSLSARKHLSVAQRPTTRVTEKNGDREEPVETRSCSPRLRPPSAPSDVCAHHRRIPPPASRSPPLVSAPGRSTSPGVRLDMPYHAKSLFETAFGL